MKQNSEKRFVRAAILATTLVVILLLEIGYIWLKNRTDWTSRMAAAAAEKGRYTRALALADRAERFGAENVVNDVCYRRAEDLLREKAYDEAEAEFAALGSYGDAPEKMLACRYERAAVLETEGQLEQAAGVFASATGYKDALLRRDKCVYALAEAAEEKGQYEEAARLFNDASGIADATERANGALYRRAEKLLTDGDSREAFLAFSDLGAFSDAHARAVSVAVDMTGETDEQAAMAAAGGYSAEQWEQRLAYRQQRDSIKKGTLAAGWGHAVALKADGTVLTAGDDSFGQCQTAAWINIVSVGAGARHTVGLKKDGTVIAAGDNAHGQCDVSEWTDITAIAVGDWDTFGLKADGTVVHCGFSEDEKILSWNGIRSVTAGGNAFGAVRAGGTVLIGFDSAQCGEWNDVGELAIGTGWAFGLTNEGTVLAHGYAAPAWEHVLTLDASATVLGGLDADGTVQTIALMPHAKALAEAVSGEKDVAAFVLGATWALLQKTDGTYLCTGADASGPDISAWNRQP